jgi:hypothetical protein
MTIQFSDAAAGKTTWDAALATIQHNTEVFGASMGYKIAPDSSGAKAQAPGDTVVGLPPSVWTVLVLAALTAAAILFVRRRNRRPQGATA